MEFRGNGLTFVSFAHADVNGWVYSLEDGAGATIQWVCTCCTPAWACCSSEGSPVPFVSLQQCVWSLTQKQKHEFLRSRAYAAETEKHSSTVAIILAPASNITSFCVSCEQNYSWCCEYLEVKSRLLTHSVPALLESGVRLFFIALNLSRLGADPVAHTHLWRKVDMAEGRYCQRAARALGGSPPVVREDGGKYYWVKG